MESKNEQGSRKDPIEESNQAVNGATANNFSSSQEISESNQDVRQGSSEQVNTEYSGEGVYEKAPPLTGLAKGYNFANALEEYDPKEMRPQAAEFWRYRSATYEKQGHI